MLISILFLTFASPKPAKDDRRIFTLLDALDASTLPVTGADASKVALRERLNVMLDGDGVDEDALSVIAKYIVDADGISASLVRKLGIVI